MDIFAILKCKVAFRLSCSVMLYFSKNSCLFLGLDV